MKISAAHRRTCEKWLLQLTSLPTAAGRELRVSAWIEAWVAARPHLRLTRDAAGNLFVHRAAFKAGAAAATPGPVYITAHLDHPAFVVDSVDDDRRLTGHFRGGVHDPYFVKTKVEVIDAKGKSHPGVITELDSATKPFKTVRVRLTGRTSGVKPGDVMRWLLPKPAIVKGKIHTHACDDLAAAAAALGAYDLLSKMPGMEHVGLIFTLAEEIGFIGAIAAARSGSIPKSARLICLENSRSFAESPIGGGPILRVGDRITVFSPALTNRLGQILIDYQKVNADFVFQRKLMPGGACEASAFASYGYESTCLCLPLGNYHNMEKIDEVQAGKAKAKIGREFVSVDDFHGLVRMLLVCLQGLDAASIAPLRDRMEKLYADHAFVLAATE